MIILGYKPSSPKYPPEPGILLLLFTNIVLYSMYWPCVLYMVLVYIYGTMMLQQPICYRNHIKFTLLTNLSLILFHTSGR